MQPALASRGPSPALLHRHPHTQACVPPPGPDCGHTFPLQPTDTQGQAQPQAQELSLQGNPPRPAWRPAPRCLLGPLG